MTEQALTDEQQKELVIDAICGMGVHPGMPVIRLEEAKYIRWTGNQYNESWAWERPMLASHSAAELLALYMEMKYASK